MDAEKFKPTPVDLAALKADALATPEGRLAYEEAQAEFAILDAIAQAVKDSALTQEELAVRMGTSQAAISRLLHGKRTPRWSTVQKLFRATGHSIKAIVLTKLPQSAADASQKA